MHYSSLFLLAFSINVPWLMDFCFVSLYFPFRIFYTEFFVDYYDYLLVNVWWPKKCTKINGKKR